MNTVVTLNTPEVINTLKGPYTLNHQIKSYDPAMSTIKLPKPSDTSLNNVVKTFSNTSKGKEAWSLGNMTDLIQAMIPHTNHINKRIYAKTIHMF